MPKKCWACGIYSSKGEIDRSYYRWPAAYETQQLWMKHLGLTQIVSNAQCLFICSDHFSNDDFDLKNCGAGFRKYLKSDAKPKRLTLVDVPREMEQGESSARSTTKTPSPVGSDILSDIKQISSSTHSPLRKRRKIDVVENIGSLPELLVPKRKRGPDSSVTPSCSSFTTLTASDLSETLTAPSSDHTINKEIDTACQPHDTPPQTLTTDHIQMIEQSGNIYNKPIKAKRRLKLKRYAGDLKSEDFSSSSSEPQNAEFIQ